MPVKIEPTSKIKARLGLEPNGRVQKYFTNECAKAMDRYVPFDTGTLAETAVQNGEPTQNVKSDTITYETPYAKYVYYGITKNGEEMNYHKDKHKDAGKYWDKRMWSAKGKDIVKSVQKYIDSGVK